MSQGSEPRSGSSGKEGEGFLIRSFSVANTQENRELLKQAHKMANADDGPNSFSKLVVRALTEYIKRHAPGNPQLNLVHWTEGVPLPESTRHVHLWHLVRSAPWAVVCRDRDCPEGWFQLGAD